MLAVEGYRTYRRLCGDSIDIPEDAAAYAVEVLCENELGYADSFSETDDIPVLSVGLTEYRSVRALKKHSDNWEDWKSVIRAELESVIAKKGAMVFKSASEFQAVRAQYGARVEIVHLVTPAVVKHNAQGEVCG